MKKNPIDRAIEAAGGRKRLAEALEVTPGLISQWTTGRRPMAARHAREIERITGVTRYDLRPDIFGPGPEKAEAA